MLSCDLVVAVRAARSLNGAQVVQLDRELRGRALEPHERDLLFLLDSYAERADPAWAGVLARALDAVPAGAVSARPRARAQLRLVHAA
jgi:hypothetical protein